MTHKYRSDHAPHNQPDPQTERESQLSVVSPQSLPPPSRHYYTRSLLKMFAVANTSALRVSAKAPVTARRTVAPKAALVADLKKVAKKAAPAILTLTEGSGTRATLRVRDTRDAHLGFWKDTIVTRRPSGRGRVSPVPESSAPPAARVIAKRYPKSGLTRAARANQHEKYLSEMKRVVTPETFPLVGARASGGAPRGGERRPPTTAPHDPHDEPPIRASG